VRFPGNAWGIHLLFITEFIMANGFQAVRVLGASGTCGIVETYFYNAGAAGLDVAIGDVVDKSTLAATDNDGFPGCVAATGTLAVASLGVVVGFEVDPQNLLQTGRLQNVDAIVRIAIDPRQVYAVEVPTGIFTAASFGGGASTLATEATVSNNFITSNMTVTAPASIDTVLPWYVVGGDPETLQSDNSFLRIYVRPNANSFYLGSGVG
jgi:hypothetical protein